MPVENFYGMRQVNEDWKSIDLRLCKDKMRIIAYLILTL
jgi:hypothetical protein